MVLYVSAVHLFFFFFIAKQYSITDITQFVMHSSDDTHLCSFQFFCLLGT